jgi:hypothetical protein
MKRSSCAYTVGRLVPNGLEPYGLPDGAWLAPCEAVATILIAKLGRHLWRSSHNTILLYSGSWLRVVCSLRIEKQGISLIIINYYVVEG